MADWVDFKKVYEYQLAFDKPIIYKELIITPVKMSEYFNYYFAVNCLMIKKNKTSDARIISMSNLDYLFYLILNSKEGEICKEMLGEILRISCNLAYDDIKYTVDEKNRFELLLKGKKYNKKDFDEIKRIILYQNSPDYSDKYIDANLERALDEYARLSSKCSGVASLEDQMILVMRKTGLKIDDIENLTIRKFIKIVRQSVSELDYQIYKTASVSGMVEFKNPIDHYLYIRNSKFDSLIEYGSFKKKIENA